MLVGVVVGIGIFGFPPLVARYASSPAMYMGFWIVGAAVMLMGALCYAELGSAYPHEGGEYHYLTRAWGRKTGFLFAWSRGMVVQTGAIAAAAFIYSEYAQDLVPLGRHGTALHAAMAVVASTLLNLIGTRESKNVQHVFTAATLIILATIIGAGLLASHADPGAGGQTGLAAPPDPSAASWAMGLVLVLITYGGWNEAAYLSGELREPRRNVSRVLVAGTLVVAVWYILANAAFLHIFGLDGLRQSNAVAADLMRVVAGPYGGIALSAAISITALSTINSSVLTGARVYYALGRDVPRLGVLGRWHAASQSPRAALLLQAAIVLALIAFGDSAGNSIETMVAYTAPVFWLFMTLVALSVWRLRKHDGAQPRPFRTPGYPVVPALFALICAVLTVYSARYAGPGAIAGLVVLASGLPLLHWVDEPTETCGAASP